jgi:4-hydroxy-3-methylbut-2-enyl diphosphate reductase
MEQTDRQLLIASPRGFCAGVVRAVEVVDRLLAEVGAPLYVRKEIVHNQAVVRDFRRRGVVFVDDLDEVPDGSTVVFSAHGVGPDVLRSAHERRLKVVDATCPLVTKVHREVLRHAKAGRKIVLIGHAGHDEVLGTMGEAPDAITLVTDIEDVATLEFAPGTEVGYVTQTTLSVDETKRIVEALRERFPDLIEPRKSDICYATQNRQDAVKDLVAHGATHVIVVGSGNSSNSLRLCEVARRAGAESSLLDGPDDLELDQLRRHEIIGLTAGASAPEHLVRAIAEELAASGWKASELLSMVEDVKFELPPGVAKSPSP